MIPNAVVRRQDGEDRVALLERPEPLDPEDRAERRRQAQPAGHDREEDVADDQQAPLEGGRRPEDLPAGRQGDERGDGVDAQDGQEDPNHGRSATGMLRTSGHERAAGRPRRERHVVVERGQPSVLGGRVHRSGLLDRRAEVEHARAGAVLGSRACGSARG